MNFLLQKYKHISFKYFYCCFGFLTSEDIHTFDSLSCYWFIVQVSGHGIDSLAKFFLDLGYSQRDELRFPAKKLKALWFSPPSLPIPEGGSGINGPLPRVFISELLVDQMSSEAQVCYFVSQVMSSFYKT